VPRESINRLYWDIPYHLSPGGKTGIEAFAVIREAMRKTGMVALGRLVMSTRERICALEVEEDALMTTLRTAEEVRAIEDIEPSVLPKPDPRMLDITQKIIEQQADDFSRGLRPAYVDGRPWPVSFCRCCAYGRTGRRRHGQRRRQFHCHRPVADAEPNSMAPHLSPGPHDRQSQWHTVQLGPNAWHLLSSRVLPVVQRPGGTIRRGRSNDPHDH
jgi:hypothetical protein